MKPLARLLLLLIALAPASARAAGFPVLGGDPVDAASGDPYFIFPGLPLILPPANGHGEQPVVDQTKIGDVDLVVRAGTPMVGPAIPAPVDPPVVGVAGGTRIAEGTEIPFTVVVSDGQTPPVVGNPLLGPEMDGLPVVVFAFADLDGDGIVGPTDADPDGALDDAREEQEALYVVGRQVALFTNGVATGTIAVAAGAPVSAGGLRIVLTAAAYVGTLTPGINIPPGPPIATLFPFLPTLDPTLVVEGGGRGGRAGADVRVSFALEPAVPPLVGDRTLGTPFALPTDGSSPTIDRVDVASGAFARARFVRPSVAAGFPVGAPVPLFPGAGGALFEALPALDVPDDGPGGGVAARLVPVDRLDNITDPPPGTTVTLLADPGLVILAPDTDGDPSQETVALSLAAGLDVVLGDAGGANDSGAGASLTVVSGGFPTEVLAVHFTPVAAPTTTTTTTVTSTTATSLADTTTTTSVPATTTTSLPGATTTTTSSVPSTSTTLPDVTTTVTTTTTTTTTLPSGCATAPSFAGAACRLAALSAAIDVGVPAGRSQDQLVTQLGRARVLLQLAVDLVTQSARPAARTKLSRTRTALARLAARLRTRAVVHLVGRDVRARLLADTGALQQEIRALRAAL